MKIEKLDYYGRGIAYPDGKICFVENALEEEDVSLNLIKDKKKYCEAEVIMIKNKNLNRVQPKCPYYDQCGGCMIMHMGDSYQRTFKRRKVEEILSRALDFDILISKIVESKMDHYRNKVTFHVENGKIGYYQKRTNHLIEVNQCLLLKEKINQVLKRLRGYIKKEHEVTKVTIKLGNQTEEVMVILEGRVKQTQEILKLVDVLVVDDQVVSNKKSILSHIGDQKYLISKNSFFQVNEEITKKLYDQIVCFIKKRNSSYVLDLYCGTGTIGIYLSLYVEKVVGIEVVEDAVRDAHINKKMNHASNISFILGKVEDHLEIFDDRIDTVILDPPRNGLKDQVIAVLNQKKIKTIIYVSCDPITLGRDLKRLSMNYYLVDTILFDMFPNTYHVECICLMSRK
ncbi:MAG: 23S rRNA (uracil(1939)-C(5))-methyltransferase RlmD [Bacilli bacterium]|nr:23S rRNA (uracil(1939)-C(5))-methyltransferase RlmD [Bacilli bacterium]